LVARKLALAPGMRVLDMGCGWGGAARFFAERYEVDVTAVTISREQAAFAARACRGLPVHVERADYRAITGRYDRIYSLGMFEHVGWRNHRGFLAAMAERLERDGLFLLHTIGRRVSHAAATLGQRVYLPELAAAVRGADRERERGQFVIEDWHNFGADYDATLLAWYANFERAWPRWRRVTAAGSAHVALLPADLGGRLPRAAQPALADRALAARRSARLRSAR
jgi:cyclopropane-fatty-acyl-phospholipid synthase